MLTNRVLRAPTRALDSSSVKPLCKALVHDVCERDPTLRFGSFQGDAGALDENAKQRHLSALGKFSTCRESLDRDVLRCLNGVFGSHMGPLDQPRNMRRLLEAVGFVRPGDNIHRLLTTTKLDLPNSVLGYVDKHVNPTDPFDRWRTSTTDFIYAIDSATTSEVDDAIGMEMMSDGRARVTVYVADATAYVPFDSDLETLSGRSSGTTVYLPEGVFFMLPKPIIQAATLESGRRCRTFNISFCVDEEGSVADFSVSVGFTTHLQRITYDEAQDVIDTITGVPSSVPSWVRESDATKLRELRKIGDRLRRRQDQGSVNLPDPYVRADPNTLEVTDLHDQVSRCADAYALVASFMIAANEVCSRVAQQHDIPIPFRGSRPLSSVHQAAREYRQPDGRLRILEGHQLPAAGEFAVSLLNGLDRLRGVSRAMYHHKPLWHNGLNTWNYCHSTSPLRRYPDMLVHHQLKCMIAREQGLPILVPIEEFQMAELCQASSMLQLNAALMQTYSQRFWVLKFLSDSRRGKVINAVAGFTYTIDSCPDERRSLASGFRFVTDVYIPELHTLESVAHNDDSIRIGSQLACTVTELEPSSNRMTLRLMSATSSTSPGQLEDLLKGATVAD